MQYSRKKCFCNKYSKIRSRDNWDKYRTQRNLVNKIKRKSIREYFIERCVGGPKQNVFWPTIKPFNITNKGSYFENNIILTDDDRIVNDQNEVAETFNEFFVTIAKNIGKESCAVNQEHPSVKVISEHSYSENKSKFESIAISFVEKQIDKMNVNKATGKDSISGGQVIIPTAHYSDSPLFRRPFIPTAHCSDSPFLRQPIIPSKMVKSSIIILKSFVFLLYLTED
jgi:hypothetical protein